MTSVTQQKQIGKTTDLTKLPLSPGTVFQSPGGSFTYKVIGAVCRLYDKKDWDGWDGEGNRFVADFGSKNHESYCVTLIDEYSTNSEMIFTFAFRGMDEELKKWWFENAEI